MWFQPSGRLFRLNWSISDIWGVKCTVFSIWDIFSFYLTFELGSSFVYPFPAFRKPFLTEFRPFFDNFSLVRVELLLSLIVIWGIEIHLTSTIRWPNHTLVLNEYINFSFYCIMIWLEMAKIWTLYTLFLKAGKWYLTIWKQL